MSDLIWYRHEQAGEALQPRAARPLLAQSGWFPMPEEEVAAREQAAVDAVLADEQAMQAAPEDAEEAPPEVPDNPTEAAPPAETLTEETE